MAQEDYKDDVKFGDVMTVEDFRHAVDNGDFINYDGFCHPAVLKQDSTRSIYPSQIDELLPDDCTHVVWFNR